MKKATNHTVPQKFSEKNKKLINYKKVFAVLAVFTVIIICLTAMTASKMNDAVNEKTTNYVQDVSLQLAAHIDFRLQNNIQNLELVAAGVMGIGEYENTEELQMFLKSQMKKLGFNSFIIVSVDGDIHSTSDAEIDIGSMNGLNSAFKGKNGVDFLDEQSILYSIPIYSGDEIKGALGGIRDKKNMQKLIRAESFSGQSMTCITDTNGNVVISPEKLEPFLQLDGIFNKKTDIETVENIYMMKENMEKKIGGEFIFTAVNGERLILSYDPLESYDWVLLTLVPVDLISSEVNFYVKYTFVIIFVIISAFVIFLITAFKTYGKYYRQLRDFAFTDSVTGKINNAAFQIKCAELIENAKPNTYSVVLINIRNFKLINENSGSAEGDRTLKYVMDIISKNINEDEIAARADADNFFLCIKENNKNVIDKRLKGIISDINSYNDSMEKIYRLTLKQGVYIVDDPTLEITVMQDRAKTACRSKAADEDERCIYYDSSVTKQMKTEQELNDSFENSIKNRDFKVFLQPKIYLKTGKTGGAEALVRWMHPSGRMIPPNEFIPLFEKNKKICRLDLYVFEEVCNMLKKRIDSGKEIYPVSVNISRRHFENENFLLEFEKIAEKYNVPKHLIEFELTESIFFDDQGIEHVKNQINEMHKKGFKCSLDDFGAGYSSLGLLMEFDIDTIKLDRRFFINIENKKTQDVVKSIIMLSKKINALTVAEGIETQEQLTVLQSIDCDMVQGYIFSRPLPEEELEQWETRRNIGNSGLN